MQGSALYTLWVQCMNALEATHPSWTYLHTHTHTLQPVAGPNCRRPPSGSLEDRGHVTPSISVCELFLTRHTLASWMQVLIPKAGSDCIARQVLFTHTADPTAVRVTDGGGDPGRV